MQNYKFSYAPKRKAASSRTVIRPVGPTGERIHMHDSAELILITTPGRCKWFSNGNVYLLPTPALIWNRAGAFHELLEVYEQDARCCVCFYKAQLLAQLPKQLRYDSLFEGCDLLALPLNQSQLEGFLPLFALVQDVALSQKRFLLPCIFDKLSQLLSAGETPIRSGTTLTYIFQVTALLQNPEGEKLTLKALAERFHVSQSKLKSDFKKVTDMPIHSFRRHVQLQSARILLETTQQELAQIAYSCGFADESYFIRVFRKEFGVTPSNYRKQYK